MRKIKVLFRLSFLYHRAALDPVYEVMKNDDRFDIYFSCEDEKVRKFLFLKSRRREAEDLLRKEGRRIAITRKGFDVVITGDTIGNPGDYGRTLLVFINHGTGIKNVLYRNLAKSRGTKYMIFVEGEYRKRKILEKGVLGKSEVYVVGYTKLDPIFQGRYRREEVLAELGLDPAKKTVLFAPTHKPSCIKYVREHILDATRDHNLIIKLHPYSWSGSYAPHSHHRIYEKAVKKFDHAVLVPPEKDNILPFLVAADVLVSEASSTIFEFLALGKIGVIYDLPHQKLRHHDGTPVLDEDPEEFLRGAYPHVKSPEQLRKAIERALNPDSGMLEEMEKWRSYLFYGLDGRASKRAVELIVRLLEEGGHENVPSGATT